MRSIVRAAVQEKLGAPAALPDSGLKYSLIPLLATSWRVFSVSSAASLSNSLRLKPSIISQLVLTQVGPCQYLNSLKLGEFSGTVGTGHLASKNFFVFNRATIFSARSRLIFPA